MSKRRLAVLFGGISVEHEVSVITGVQLMNHANPELYEVVPVYIDKKGQWWTGTPLADISYFQTADLAAPANLKPFFLNPNPGSNFIDVAVLCFHGAYGEAGNIQGLLELAQIPYQGPGVTSSAVAFDKIMTRQILTAEQVTQTPYVWFTQQMWTDDQATQLAAIEKLGLPIFIKPANGGSTVGIEKIKTSAELVEAVKRVLQYDQRVLVEAEIKDCIEVNVSVLGNSDSQLASITEQPIKADEFLSYADKYERGGKKSGMASATRRIPAPISSHLSTQLQELAKKLFVMFDCSGVIRIDFFVDPSEETIFVVELNTIPGSMSFYLWEASMLPYPELIDKLVAIADRNLAERQSKISSFDSNILKHQTT